MISSYGVELRKQNIPIRQTLEIYRSAVSYLTEIYGQASRRQRDVLMLQNIWYIPRKKKQARFDFDIRFPKMPSYLRRAAIQHALGSVSSYESRLEQWKRTGKKAGKPALVYENHAMPVFYRDVMYREGMEGKEEADLKLYDGHDWKWFCVRLKHTDLEYLRKNWFGKKGICPDTGKKTPQIFPSVFLYRRSNTCRNTCERTGHLQCGSGDQYGCFIRELFKPLPATERSLLEAKVPSVKRRTSCVYADLRELSSKMSSFKVS